MDPDRRESNIIYSLIVWSCLVLLLILSTYFEFITPRTSAGISGFAYLVSLYWALR